MESKTLYHHGILGQKWGVRNGPPYPLGGGDYTRTQRRKILKKRRAGNSIYNKRHFDDVLRADKSVLSTLSYDPDRTKKGGMFYATHYALDKHQYNALFNSPVTRPLYDSKGRRIGESQYLKFRIDNRVKKDLKIASEDSGAEIFRKLYERDRDFYNFVTDEKRMQDYFVQDKYKFRGYREAKEVLDKMKKPKYTPSDEDLQIVYRMFNYVIPYDGAGNKWKGHDVKVQRTKFFEEAKKAGYGGLLDTNDAIYGGFKAKSPVIVFDVSQVIPKNVYQTKMTDKYISNLIFIGRKILKQ